MKGFQIISNSADCFLIEADSFSMERYSINCFFPECSIDFVSCFPVHEDSFLGDSQRH